MKDTEIINEILVLADELSSITSRGQAAFNQDAVTRRACERVVEILGDLVGQFSEDFRELHPELRYGEAKGMRNVLAHHYLKVEPERVWEAANTSIPKLAAQLGMIGRQQTIANPDDDLTISL